MSSRRKRRREESEQALRDMAADLDRLHREYPGEGVSWGARTSPGEFAPPHDGSWIWVAENIRQALLDGASALRALELARD